MAAQTLSIIGLGLLGGSIGLAARSNLTDYTVIGYDRIAQAGEQALDKGAIDSFASSFEAAVSHASLLLICTPISVAEPIFRILATSARPGTVVSDVASTKRSIVRLAESLLPPTIPFVGSHPIAGSEKAGIASASREMLDNALCVLTPTKATDPPALALTTEFWRRLGLRTVQMSPDAHDRQFSAISHLPHAVATALINRTESASFPLAGKGFLDTTRIAAGSPELWRDILLDNADHIRSDLRSMSDELKLMADLLKPEQAEPLLMYLRRAAEARRLIGSRPANTEPPASGGASASNR